jgi:hypothetical protein
MDIKNYISSGIIEMYVMDLCTPDERQEMNHLRKQYPELDEAVVKFEELLEKNLLYSATLPGEETDKKVLQSFQSLQLLPTDNYTTQGKVKKINWLRFIAAASVLLLLASGVVNYILLEKTKDQQALIEMEKKSPLPLSDYKILQQPSITPVAMYGVAPHSICRCTMFWDKKTGKAYIMIHHLPLLSGGNYQLWAMVNGKPVSVGIINDKIRDRFIEVQNIPQDAIAFTVTLEKTGGAAAPTNEETYLSGKI